MSPVNSSAMYCTVVTSSGMTSTKFLECKPFNSKVIKVVMFSLF